MELSEAIRLIRAELDAVCSEQVLVQRVYGPTSGRIAAAYSTATMASFDVAVARVVRNRVQQAKQTAEAARG